MPYSSFPSFKEALASTVNQGGRWITKSSDYVYHIYRPSVAFPPPTCGHTVLFYSSHVCAWAVSPWTAQDPHPGMTEINGYTFGWEDA
jgi:hypothetical protein